MPAVKRASEAFREKGFLVIGVDFADKAETMREYLAKEGFEGWPQWFVGDRKKEITSQFWIAGYPTNILVGRDGRIHSRKLRFYEEGKGEAEIEKALSAP